MGNFDLKWGENFGEMEDSTHLLSQPELLRKAIATNGYALLRGVLPVEKIEAARSVVVSTLQSEWHMIDTSAPLLQARIAGDHKGVLLTGFRKVTHDPAVLNLLEGDELVALLSSLFGREPATFDNKWVRVMGRGEGTTEHTDFFRFADTAQNMHTCWIPLGQYSIFQGTLAVCEKSHLIKGYELANLPESKRDELPLGFSEFLPTAIWRSTHFSPGDVVIFDIRTVHASSKNQSDEYRLSMDTRWQPAACLTSDTRSCFRTFPRNS